MSLLPSLSLSHSFVFSLLTFSQLRCPDVLSAVTLSFHSNSRPCSSLYLCSVSLIAPHPILLSSICHSFNSSWAISSPFLIELHQFSLFFSRLSLFYCFGSMRYLICFPSPLFNSIGQLYLSLCSLALLCLFPALITSHLHSNYKHWIGKQLAASIDC